VSRRPRSERRNPEVTSRPGAFYGGWITEEIEGPFKGEQGSQDW
jgi:hypothetical protein